MFARLATSHKSFTTQKKIVFTPKVVAPRQSFAKYTTDFNNRENALENSAVYKHEKETLKKLREKLGYDKNEQPTQEQSNVHHDQGSSNKFSQSSRGDHNEENFSLSDFLVFRKEMIEKVRNLEDEVIALKYKVNAATKPNRN